MRYLPRPLWFLAAFAAVALSGCDRHQRADLILTLGFHPAFRTETAADGFANAPRSEQQSMEQLVSALFEIHEARRNARSVKIDEEQLCATMARINELCEELAKTATVTAKERRQLREAEFVVLQLANELAPAQFADKCQAFRSQHFQQQPFDAGNGDASALRILEEYLTVQRMSPHASFALGLQALTYPTCPINVQLFLTMAERLANEKQLRESLQVASDGLKLCSHLPDSPKLQEQITRLYAEQPAAPGLPFRLSGPTVHGRFFDIAGVRGKVAVVTFWASWCPASREEIIVLRKLHQTYEQEGVEFVGVSLDENQSELVKFLQANQVFWPQIFASKKGETKWDNPIVRFYKVESIPFTIVVDKQGVIVASGIDGESMIENAILEQLAR